MRLDDNYEVVLEVANEEDGFYGDKIYGDIYDDYSECEKEHPNDPILIGYEILDEEGNVFEHNPYIEPWYGDIDAAIEDWKRYLRV